jgi:hypothetical protein
VTGQGIGALETAPHWGTARDIPEESLIAVDLDLGDAVDHHFDGALAAVPSTTSDQGGASLELLRACRERNHEDRRDNYE